MAKFGLYGKISAEPNKRDELARHLLRAAELMQQAEGCELYAVGLSSSDDNDIWVAEIWRREADHAAALSLPGVQQLIATARPLIKAVSESHKVIVLGGKGVAASD